MRGYSELQNALGNVSGATTIDLSLGTVITATVTAATTFSVTNIPSSTQFVSFTLVLTNGGASTVTWMSGTKWQNSTAPDLSFSSTDVLTFFTVDNGTTWRGSVVMANSTLTSSLFVWGGAGWGETGFGDVLARSSPVQLAGTWVTFSGSQDTILMIKQDGSLFGTGRNYVGSLGLGDAVGRSSPVQVAGTWINAFGANLNNNFGIQRGGSLWSWGYNNQGQLGLGNTIKRSSPVQLAGTWSSGAAGYHSMALRTDNTLWAWGWGGTGPLGLSTDSADRSSPVQVAGTWSAVACGALHTLALRTDNTLWIWGNNGLGQLGMTDIMSRSSPVQIAGTWSKIAATARSSFAINTSGALFAWGRNKYGELGLADTVYRSSPVQISGTWSNISSCVGQPNAHMFAQKSNNSLFVWGQGRYGKLGLGDTISRSSPVQLTGTWGRVSQGRDVSLGLKA